MVHVPLDSIITQGGKVNIAPGKSINVSYCLSQENVNCFLSVTHRNGKEYIPSWST